MKNVQRAIRRFFREPSWSILVVWSCLGLPAVANARTAPSTVQAFAQANLAKSLFALQAGKAGEEATERKTLRDQFSIEHYRSLLSSTLASERLLAIERLGRIDSTQVLTLLNGALANTTASPELVNEARLLITVLAEHTDDPQTQHSLLRIVTGATSTHSNDIHPLLRSLAALALAKSGQPQALSALAKVLRSDDDSASYAAQALLAYPPLALQTLLDSPGHPSIALIELLGDLGEQRAFHSLRAWVKQGDPDVQHAAALALTRLGHYETVELARHWLKGTPSLARREVATRILAEAASPDAAAAIDALLREPDGRSTAQEIALRFPNRQLAPGLIRSFREAETQGKLSETDAIQLLTALARSNGNGAIAFISQKLKSPHFAAFAGYALALCPSAQASNAVSAALRAPETRREALRAAVVRQVRFKEEYPELLEVLRDLGKGAGDHSVDEDTALASFVRAAVSEEAAIAELKSGDPLRVSAAARTAQLHSPTFFEVAAERLSAANNVVLRTALGVALQEPKAALKVPSSVLLTMISDAGAAAPLAVFALTQRDDPALYTTIQELLHSTDTAVRAHAALGLGKSPRKDATGILVARYGTEAEASVRLAIVAALGWRRERLRERTLFQAATLDPSAAVRNSARLLRSGHKIGSMQRGHSAMLVRLEAPKVTDPRTTNTTGSVLFQSAGVQLSPLLSLPFVAEPSGLLLVLGVPQSSLEVTVAAPLELPKAEAPK